MGTEDGKKKRQTNLNRKGRAKGCKNLFSKDVRNAILEAFHERGGVKWLKNLSDDNFVKILTKVIPVENLHSGEVKMSFEQLIKNSYRKTNEKI